MFKELITASDQPQWKCRSKQEINWFYGLLLPSWVQRNTQVCKETECFSERRYISIYKFIYPFVLKPPTGAFWNRDLFPFMLQCCMQTGVELQFTTGNLQKVWRFKVCMGLSEFLRSASLMVSAYSLVLEALPGEIPDGNRDIIWLQRAQTKIRIQAPDRFKRGLKTQCTMAKHAQTLLCMPDMHRFFDSSWESHRKKHRKVILTRQKKRHFVGFLWF